MSARRLVIGIILVSFPVLVLLFNNCAKSDSSSSSAASEPVVATEIIGPMVALIRTTTQNGKIYGYAMDSGNKTAVFRVYFYVNGPAGSGTFLGTAVANEPIPGPYDGHQFSFQLPNDLINGQSQPIFIHVHDETPENMLYPAPYGVIAYPPKAKDFFQQNIAPFLANNCVRCHSTAWTYENTFYGPLMNPMPISGGSPSNNKLYRKMSGIEAHNGNAFCGAEGGAAFCNNIQAWWRAEFQSN